MVLTLLKRNPRAAVLTIPTRPYPSVPNEPGVRTALSPVAGLFDRMRDAVSGRGTEA